MPDRLHALLRTPEEEREIRQRGEQRTTFKAKAPNGSEIAAMFVAQHSQSREEMEPTITALNEENPDIVLVEGNLLETSYPDASPEELLNLDEEEVLKNYGEQAYVILLARKKGKEVHSWDVSPFDQLQLVLTMKDEKTGENKYRPEEIVAWIAAYATRTTYHIAKERPSADMIRKRVQMFWGPEGESKARSLGIDLSDENIENALVKYAGVSLKELAERFDDEKLRKFDEARMIEMTEPELASERRVTSDVLRDMNIMRDRHAIDAIRKMQQANPGKKIFVTGGASHLTTWEPALEALYPEKAE